MLTETVSCAHPVLCVKAAELSLRGALMRAPFGAPGASMAD